VTARGKANSVPCVADLSETGLLDVVFGQKSDLPNNGVLLYRKNIGDLTSGTWSTCNDFTNNMFLGVEVRVVAYLLC
jgi:hypothetical protein